MATSQVKSCGACDAWIDFTADRCPECGAYQGLLEPIEATPRGSAGRERSVGWVGWTTAMCLFAAFVLFALAVWTG